MVSLANPAEGDDESAEEEAESESEENEVDDEPRGEGILGEKLKPRKELPPLLLPLTEVEAPRLDWIGTSLVLPINCRSSGAVLECGCCTYVRQRMTSLVNIRLLWSAPFPGEQEWTTHGFLHSLEILGVALSHSWAGLSEISRSE
jgi:hypothetical protein